MCAKDINEGIVWRTTDGRDLYTEQEVEAGARALIGASSMRLEHLPDLPEARIWARAMLTVLRRESLEVCRGDAHTGDRPMAYRQGTLTGAERGHLKLLLEQASPRLGPTTASADTCRICAVTMEWQKERGVSR